MNRLELWRFRVRDPITGKRYVTRYVTTEQDAKERYPDAERVEGTLEVREVIEGQSTGTFLRNDRKP